MTLAPNAQSWLDLLVVAARELEILGDTPERQANIVRIKRQVVDALLAEWSAGEGLEEQVEAGAEKAYTEQMGLSKDEVHFIVRSAAPLIRAPLVARIAELEAEAEMLRFGREGAYRECSKAVAEVETYKGLWERAEKCEAEARDALLPTMLRLSTAEARERFDRDVRGSVRPNQTRTSDSRLSPSRPVARGDDQMTAKAKFDLGVVSQWVTLLCVMGYLVVEPSREGPAFLIAMALPFAAIAVLLGEARRIGERP